MRGPAEMGKSIMNQKIRENLITNGILPEELAALDAIQVALDARYHFTEIVAPQRSGDYRRNDMLWNLLSALRGPDGCSEELQHFRDSYEVKARTTVVIRSALFSKESFPADIDAWTEVPSIDLNPEDQTQHFRDHIRMAAGACGIEVRASSLTI